MYDSKAYTTFRPSPPGEIIDRIINYVAEKIPYPLDHAVDVGCGSGQSTAVLAPYFRQVTGCDNSDTQIEQAILNRSHNNIQYKVASAEDLPFPDSSITLVTACTCLHWFDKEKFFQKLDRVLVPEGTFAAFGPRKFWVTSEDPDKDLQFAHLNTEVFEKTLNIYRSPNVQSFMNCYEDVHFPLVDLKRETGIPVVFESTGAHLAGYISSTSFFLEMKRKNPNEAAELLDYVNRRIKEILGFDGNLEDINQKFKQEYFLILGRKSSGLT